MITYRQPFVGEYPITQKYGEIIPGVTINNKPHTGIDYGCPYGTPILASAEGTVISAGWDTTGYGLCVIIQHPDRKATLYAHLSKVYVNKGDKVRQGQEIGLSGASGNITGAHLHFESRENWYNYLSHRDPITFLPMMSVDDTPSHTEQTNEKKDILPEGKYTVTCSVAWVRDWLNVERSYTISRGTEVYVFPEVKYKDGLPYRYIGADRCIAEYDSEGTKILGK